MTATVRLLVPLDDSPNAMAVLPVARGLAILKSASVAVIHVGGEALDLTDRMKLSAEDVRGLVIDHCAGRPADAIVREAASRHAALIVMCAPPELDPFESVPGDVLKRVMCPVVFVPPIRDRHPWALRQLVLPHDGTPTSAAAIAPAADLASQAGADLVVLHIATPGAERPGEPGSFVAPRYLDQPQHEWPAWEREFLDRVRGLAHPNKIDKIRLVLAQGEAGGAIVEFARHNSSDLIALAWRGSAEPERARTIRRVIRDASCPVIVFRVQV
jgi:nucleotide-binding universal stress UspA family protein